jgi:beta-galactosidase
MKYWKNSRYYFILFLLLQGILVHSQRQDISLDKDWESFALPTQEGKEWTMLPPLDSYKNWSKVTIPHNWDQYEGYRRLQHGNFHGLAVYRKNINIKQAKTGKRFFLWFEGVGSFARVSLNGKEVGAHAGGRTSFTIDVTDYLLTDGRVNTLQVIATHPPNIKTLPWVCGGCSDERGFSEGSQPLGIFRPVHLVITNDVRISPFGVHAWADITGNEVKLNVNTSLKNYAVKERKLVIVHQLLDGYGKLVERFQVNRLTRKGDSVTVAQAVKLKMNPARWSVERPYLYTIETILMENNKVIDRVSTPFGFRTINWKTPSNQFLLNDQPVFINGIAEYEHLLGQSHAFSKEQIYSRINWIQSAGFNAFRDGHQPHNLLYGDLCDQRGILWWTQLSAHVWYDTPEFRKNFKELLREWVIERRNSPSVILWGLQNESKLPEDFAKECTELIRSLDPTASSQRLVTTCNGGTGTDWDVPQNWTGTYGGNPDDYGKDLKKQVLVGEYGAWRSIDLHSEGGYKPDGPLSEDRFTALMEKKVRLAESVKDSVAGHFFWLLTSHDNPGRVQGGEGLREIDRIGPVNYKGLLTPWEEPTDAYYMFRSNYVSAEKDPMVYIASHTWPNRWMSPGIKNGIVVYSNCEEVELFNDLNNVSLGKRRKNGTGTHFQWDSVNIQYNVLYAVGYQQGKVVTSDTLVLFHLPEASGYKKLYRNDYTLLQPLKGYNYSWRVNCGGPDYVDQFSNIWSADQGISKSWTAAFPDLPEYFASQRRSFSPVRNSKDWKLFQHFRYGKEKLIYTFNKIPAGECVVELYFMEPWIGVGGEVNAKGKRVFDVAINGKTVIDDLDIWAEAGTNKVLKKTIKVNVEHGKLEISFPESKAGQAIISAIALAVPETNKQDEIGMVLPVPSLVQNSWLDIGDRQYLYQPFSFHSLPPALYGASWIQFRDRNAKASFQFGGDVKTDLFIAVQQPDQHKELLDGFENMNSRIVTDENSGTTYFVYRKQLPAGKSVKLVATGECIIAEQPASNIQPAFDLKPVTPYRSNVAILSEGIHKDSLGGRLCCMVHTLTGESIEWPVQTGVGDIYSITVKYYYPENQPLKARLQLYDAGGNRMMSEEVQFTFTREGKWNQFTVNTGTQINAGNYTVKLIVEQAAGLAVSGIEIQ